MMEAVYPNLAHNTCLPLPYNASDYSFCEKEFLTNEIDQIQTEKQVAGYKSVTLHARCVKPPPEQLSDNELEEIIDIWNRKP